MSNNATVTIPYNAYQDLLKTGKLKADIKTILRKGELKQWYEALSNEHKSAVMVSGRLIEELLTDLCGKTVQIKSKY